MFGLTMQELLDIEQFCHWKFKKIKTKTCNWILNNFFIENLIKSKPKLAVEYWKNKFIENLMKSKLKLVKEFGHGPGIVGKTSLIRIS